MLITLKYIKILQRLAVPRHVSPLSSQLLLPLDLLQLLLAVALLLDLVHIAILIRIPYVKAFQSRPAWHSSAILRPSSAPSLFRASPSRVSRPASATLPAIRFKANVHHPALVAHRVAEPRSNDDSRLDRAPSSRL